jgi:hypothetical protein
MDPVELEYHMDTLKEWDELDVVDCLRLTTEEIIEAFEERAIQFIKDNWE